MHFALWRSKESRASEEMGLCSLLSTVSAFPSHHMKKGHGN